jgi:hypothetical protein
MLHDQHFRSYPQTGPYGGPGGQLSWRVHVLPYLGHVQLYNKFHMNEPWDSPHNKALLAEIPPIYDTGDGTSTTLRSFAGPECVAGNLNYIGTGIIGSISRNILAAFNVGDSLATPWTRPDDLPPTPENIAAVVNSLGGNALQGATLVGETLQLSPEQAKLHLAGLSLISNSTQVSTEKLREESGPALPLDASFTQEASQIVLSDKKRMEQLKQLVNGFLNYESVHRTYPIKANPAHFDKNGKPFVSWRVHILPFIGQEPLYRQFKLDEPWDGPNNKKLIAQMPAVFRDPDEPPKNFTTRMLRFSGPATPSNEQLRSRIGSVQFKFMLACVAKKHSEVWSKPADIEFDPADPFHYFDLQNSNSIVCIRGDGAGRCVKSCLPAELFVSLVDSSTPFPNLPQWAASFNVNTR